jgi:hypothetical protein
MTACEAEPLAALGPPDEVPEVDCAGAVDSVEAEAELEAEAPVDPPPADPPFDPLLEPGADTLGVETLGVFTDGVDTVVPGTVTDGTVTDGTVTDGTVTEGTLTEGVVSMGRAPACEETACAQSTPRARRLNKKLVAIRRRPINTSNAQGGQNLRDYPNGYPNLAPPIRVSASPQARS